VAERSAVDPLVDAEVNGDFSIRFFHWTTPLRSPCSRA
jgi:hypothetical protein